MRSTQVFPLDGLDPSFIRAFEKDCPDAVMLLHPVFKSWQVYERKPGQWGPQRLTDVLRHHYENRVTNRKSFWWSNPEAPKLILDCKGQEPGEWMLEALRAKRMDNVHMSREQMVRDAEYANQLKERKEEERASSMHKYMALDGFYRIARDFVRGDSLAGKRKWSQSVQGTKGQKGGRRRDKAT